MESEKKRVKSLEKESFIKYIDIQTPNKLLKLYDYIKCSIKQKIQDWLNKLNELLLNYENCTISTGLEYKRPYDFYSLHLDILNIPEGKNLFKDILESFRYNFRISKNGISCSCNIYCVKMVKSTICNGKYLLETVKGSSSKFHNILLTNNIKDFCDEKNLTQYYPIISHFIENFPFPLKIVN